MLSPSPEIELDNLLTLVRDRGRAGRSITAIAGPPGSGKSTVADDLAHRLNREEPVSAAVLPMDGYHFDDAILVARGWRARKGAPHTFDVAGFAHMLARLHANAEPEVAVPVFDRGLEVARNSARVIPVSVRHLIVEGNYLLVDEPPWSELARYFDTTVFLDVPPDVLRDRLTARWQALEPAARARKLDDNDLPNAAYCLERSRTPEFVIRNVDAGE